MNSCLISKKISIHSKNNIDCSSIPELNQKIIEFVNESIGKKVDRGECWDLAAKSLNIINAEWDGEYQYGKKVSHLKDCIFPGDIIQFKDVIIKYEENGTKYTETMIHHTAIIYEVYNSERYLIAHQNTNFSGKKVGLSTLNLNYLKKGKIMIYRPIL